MNHRTESISRTEPGTSPVTPAAVAGSAEDECEVVITRVFDAPRDLVFRAWTDPEHAVHWYGPAGYTTPICEMDVRPGGAYQICMRSPRGSDCWERGVFREVVVPERIVSVYVTTVDDQPGVELTSDVTFEDVDGKTRVTVRQTFFDSNFTRGAEVGWAQTLDRLTRYLDERYTIEV